MSKGSVTVNKDDVAHHSDNASNWWNPEGPVRLLHKLNPMRVQFISEAVDRPFQEEGDSLKGIKILDAACGGGLLSENLAKLGAEVVGVDASEKLIEEAKNHAALNPMLRHNVPKYIYTTVEEHAAIESGTYDVVVASEILEHVLDHDVFLRACVQALRPGGHLILTTPHKTWKGWFCSIFWLETLLAEIPRGTHHYKYYTSEENTTQILAKYDCIRKQVRSFGYSYMTGSWSWQNDGAWYAMHARKIE